MYVFQYVGMYESTTEAIGYEQGADLQRRNLTSLAIVFSAPITTSKDYLSILGPLHMLHDPLHMLCGRFQFQCYCFQASFAIRIWGVVVPCRSRVTLFYLEPHLGWVSCQACALLIVSETFWILFVCHAS